MTWFFPAHELKLLQDFLLETSLVSKLVFWTGPTAGEPVPLQSFSHKERNLPSFEGFRETFNMRASIKQKLTKKRCCEAKGRNTYAIAENEASGKSELCRLYIHHRLSNTSLNDSCDGGSRSLNSITKCSIRSFAHLNKSTEILNLHPQYTLRGQIGQSGSLEDSLLTISETSDLNAHSTANSA